MKKQTDMTTGSIPKLLIQFAIPLLLGNLFQQLYNMVDTWVVGNYVGDTAFSAVGTVSSILNTFILAFNGFANGAGVVVSQYFGAKRDEDVKKTVHTMFLIAIISCVVLSVASYALTPAMLHAMNSPEGVYEEQLTYLHIIFAFLSFQILYNMASALLRAIGDSTRPFLFLVFASVTNVVLDLLFAIKFKMGVAGVAWATIISQGVSAICSCVLLFTTTTSIRIRFSDLHFDKKKAGQIVKVAIPTSFQQCITSFSNVFVQGYINVFGASVMGGWTIYNKVEQIVSLTQQSISFSTMTFVGQNLGAGKEKRAKRGVWTAIGVSCSIVTILVIILVAFSVPIASIFTDSEEIIQWGSYFLKIVTPPIIIGTVAFTLTAAQRGAGNSFVPMLITMFSYVVFRQIYLFAVSRIWVGNLLPVAYAYPAGWFVCAVISVIYYFKVGFQSRQSITGVKSEE